MLGARTEANLAKAAAEIDPDGTHTAYLPTDISDERQCEALAALATDRFGGIDAVVHVAAWDSYFGGLEDADFGTWQQILDVNLLGTLRMTRACLPALKRAGGSVVIIGTQSAIASPNEVQQAAYAASKGALTSAMYSMARELGPHRIRVNTVLPGWMWGPRSRPSSPSPRTPKACRRRRCTPASPTAWRCRTWPPTGTSPTPPHSSPPTGHGR